MAHLIVGDVMKVLREVGIDSPQSFAVDSIAASSRNFGILDSAQFVVLLVKIGLKSFSCGQKLQDGDVASSEAAARARLLRGGRLAERKQASSHCCRAGGC
jgi:hypothetical protein